jgi:hypothetical protein
MLSLIPHPAFPAPRGLAVFAGVSATAGALALTYRLEGALHDLVLPGAGPVRRGADLWRSTCFEAFVRAPCGVYGEINLAPDGAYCAYRFDGYRRVGARDWDLCAPALDVVRAGDTLTMKAQVHVQDPALQGRVKLGLTVVVQSAAQEASFWALAHPLARPDFHHPDGCIIDLEIPA